ncbi:hypothetical protein D0962_00105 [Leptolyngbyaceae cyanobacterium CCMR0082]|uniref:Uncharacterized protein n=1 Tax=Adonisia turfae CCMR0082 TaxID=2304604 RepID=A0A6M0RYB8_9CYAN|nr:hypothetical protein [Adonisia turfae]NEZ61194.1 hypothetical protein [Adonisia turfae CCMR0082]
MTQAKHRAADSVALIFWLLASSALLIVLGLNLQPWFKLGGDVASQIEIIPLLGWVDDWFLDNYLSKLAGIVLILFGFSRISSTKLIGVACIGCGLLFLISPATIIANFGYLVGFILWAWIQIIQIAPIVVSYTPFGSHQWMSQLKQYRVAAYLIEAFACLLRFPPYANGDVGRLLADFGAMTPNPALWSWTNFFWAIATMGAVELTLMFLLKAAVAINVIQERAYE